MVFSIKCTTSLCGLTFISHRRSNVVGSKCLSLRSAHLLAEDSFCQENRNWRNSHFLVYEIDFSFSVLPFFVNCAFLAVTDHAIATMHFTVSLKNFALCGERRGTLSPRPLPPFKKRGRKLCFFYF